MPSTYSSLLRLELMATGEKSATWGDITNTNLGTLLEKSIAGLASVNVTAGNVTLTALNGTDDESRCAIISVTGTPGVSRNVVAPSSAKLYAVLNGSNAAIVFKGAATTGVTLSAGESKWLAWNGSDFVGVGSASPSFTGQIFGPAGTVSLPGYTFTGDGNTGWWAPAADTQAWSTGGSERLRVNNTGQFTQNGTAVGVAANANTALTLAMGAGAYLSAKGSGGQEMIAGADTSGVVVGSYSNHQLVLRSNNIDRVTVNSAGNVTISDPSSGYPLTVSANGTLSALFKNSNSGAVNAGVAFGSPGSSNLSAGVAGQAISGTTGALVLQYVTGSALTEGARLSQGGNFGIGQTPTFRLDAAETSSGNAVMRMVNLGTGASAHASARIESAAAGGDAYTYYIRTGTYDWYTGLDATDNYYKIGTGSVVGTNNAFVITPNSIGVGVVPTSNVDVSVAGTTIRQRLRAGAGFASILSICGNNTTAETTSFDLQMDSAGAADIVQRNNARLSIYTNGTERLRLNADGSFYGTALHNNGGTGGSTLQSLASGTYTPTCTSGTNCAGSQSGIGVFKWMRVGNVVHVSGLIGSTGALTTANTTSEFDMTIPVASNFANAEDLVGVCNFGNQSNTNGQGVCRAYANVANDRATIQFSSSTTSGSLVAVSFQYEVL